MAKGKSNSAKELNTAPELEVVEGDATDSAATVVEPEEITALLDEMAKQNEDTLAISNEASEEADSAKLDATIGDSPKVSGTAATESPAGKVVTKNDVNGSAEQIAKPTETEVKVPQSGPSFTMDQILQAASSSTGLSVDEIKSLEGEELANAFPTEPEPEVEENVNPEQSKVDEVPAIVAEEVVQSLPEEWPTSADVVAMTEGMEIRPTVEVAIESAAEEWPRAADLAAMTNGMELESPAEEISVEEIAKPKVAKTKKVKSEASGLKIPEWAMVAAGVLVSIAGGYFLTSKQSNSLESKITTKVSRIDTSLAELTELVEGTNTRLANLDRALSTAEPEPKKKLVEYSSPKSHEPPKAHEPNTSGFALQHAPETHATSPKVLKNEVLRHGEAKRPATRGNNYNSAAQIEGFQSGKIIIAGKSHSTKQSGKSHVPASSHPSVKKSPNRKKRQVAHTKANVARRNSIKVFLNGKAVTLGGGQVGTTSSSAHGSLPKGH